jgi:hypothetical protein
VRVCVCVRLTLVTSKQLIVCLPLAGMATYQPSTSSSSVGLHASFERLLPSVLLQRRLEAWPWCWLWSS